MTYVAKLISFHILERENNDNFLTWTYPTIADDQKKYILDNCVTSGYNDYICRRNNNTWFNIQQITSKSAIIVLSKEFEPHKYKLLCDILAKKYLKCQNPVDLVTLYLNLCVTGACSLQENGTIYSCNFKDFKSVTNVKEFIKSFDLEIILLYTAILLKRRVLVFGRNIQSLLNELFAITSLVPCRKVEDYLYPTVENSNKLKGLSFFVAGTSNPDFINDKHLYDLFVNMQTGEITISPKAEEIMVMTKTHKEIATFLVKLAASELPETEVINQILNKTKDLLNLLQNLASVVENDRKMITMSDLKSKKFHLNLENFLFNLAVAENMMIL